jgi:uncharacterized damage-inducible protein DinB
MQLKEATTNVFNQLKDTLSRLSIQHYCCTQPILSGSSVGQHVRHILEFYQCLAAGFEAGEVNYDLRARNHILEQYPEIAVEMLDDFLLFIQGSETKKTLTLNFTFSSEENIEAIATNLERELLYNLEHAIHHMAIIKIGILQLQPDFVFPENFGVASSTVRHQQHVHRKLSAS